MAKELTWRKAIEKVMSEATGALHYSDITDKIIEKRLRTNIGATPARTVCAHLTTAIKNEGDKSPFTKVGKGLYIWKKKTICGEPNVAEEAKQLLPVEDSAEENEPQYEVVSSFGMFWRRDGIEWSSSPKILGMQQIGAAPVNFNKQVGIYLLYDGREVIYVGRSTDRPLGRRLYEHTLDRFSARWDRFSWFGLLPVSDSGVLGKMPDSFQADIIIPVIEAILIEALEPRQNRKRGDDLSAVEYIQKEDPEIQKKRVKQTIEAALSKL